jgi:hypothetical protein
MQFGDGYYNIMIGMAHFLRNICQHKLETAVELLKRRE